MGGSFHTQWLREALESSHVKAKPLWGVPKDSSVHMPERYLGLHMPSETALHADRVAQLARLVEEHLDVDHIISLANEAATGTNDSCTVRTCGFRCPSKSRVGFWGWDAGVARDRTWLGTRGCNGDQTWDTVVWGKVASRGSSERRAGEGAGDDAGRAGRGITHAQ